MIMLGTRQAYREGDGTPLQYSRLENPVDGAAWKAAVHGVAEGRTWLNDFTFTFHFHALEKEMATHSSVLAWRTPGMGKPGGLLSMGWHRVGHDWSDLAAAANLYLCDHQGEIGILFLPYISLIQKTHRWEMNVWIAAVWGGSYYLKKFWSYKTS